MSRRARALWIVIAALPLLASRCAGGEGSGGRPPRLNIGATECAPIVGQFPPGFDWLPGTSGHAIAVQDTPPAALFFDVSGDRPELLSRDDLHAISPDSDGDGVFDEDRRLCAADAIGATVNPGRPLGISEQLAFVASSGYEEILFFRAPGGEPSELIVTNPPDPVGGSYHGEDYPYLPEASEPRTAISSKACIYLTAATAVPTLTSTGDPVGQHPCCDRLPDAASFVTSFTAGMAQAAGHLFVATSNLDASNNASGRYFPGTVLVYDFDPAADVLEIQPNPDTPVLFTTGFNPTGMSHYRTPRGRELVFVTNSGALRLGVGPSNIVSESFIDVIDAATRRLVATVPMGLAGLSFEGLAIDPAARVAMIGSWTLPVVYAIDLRAFDDEALYEQQEIIWLDGSDPVFPDARIFHADTPLAIPDRSDGPHPIVCNGWSFVAINEAGESAYVLERCDGTLTRVDLLEANEPCGGAGAPGACCDAVPLPASCFSIGSVRNLTEPFTAVTGPHGPSQIRVRPGEPGIDFVGPDVFYTLDLPEGQLCPLRIDSF